MGVTTLHTRIIHPCKTEAEWALINDIPKAGEVLFTNSGSHHGWYKVGDGTHTWSELSYNIFSGSYNDLTDKPTIPTIPTNVSSFTNDSGYLTLATLPVYDGTVV